MVVQVLLREGIALDFYLPRFEMRAPSRRIGQHGGMNEGKSIFSHTNLTTDIE